MNTRYSVKLWCIVLCSFFVAEACATLPEIGKPAPIISVADWVTGKPSGNNPLSGKIVLLEFWATWCPPCRLAIPHLNELAKSFANDRIIFLSITEETREVVEKFLTKKEITIPVVLDSLLDGEGVTRTRFGVSGIPKLFLIDSLGILRWYGYPLHFKKENLEKYFISGELPKPETLMVKDRTSNLINPNTLFSLTINRVLIFDSKTSQRGGMFKVQTSSDKIEIDAESYQPAELIRKLLNQPTTRLSIDGEIADEALDLTLRASESEATVATRRAVQTLCEMYNIILEEVHVPKKGLSLSVVNPTKLTKSPFEGGASMLVGSTWRAEGTSIDDLAKMLELKFERVIFLDAHLEGTYNFAIPVGSFDEAEKVLKDNYGIFLREDTRQVKVTVLKAPKYFHDK